jgi:hypothetical protein
MPRRVVEVVVKLKVYEDVTDGEVLDYVREACKSWKGSLFPGDFENPPDPFFDLDEKDITAKLRKP